MRCREWDTAECDDAFGHPVHQLDLLVVMIIEKEVWLVEGCARNCQ
jgi:hypothetical protein